MRPINALVLALSACALGAGAESSAPVRPGDAAIAATAAPRVDSYADIARAVGPGVVTVSSTRTMRQQPRMPPDQPELHEFFGFGERGGPGPGQAPQQQGLGSGVIVTADGYILTNSHVVRGADEVRVGLADGRHDFVARVIGTDAKSDLAVIKIDAGETALHPLRFADSATVQVGDVVLAVGNPFGVGQTVTMGIISATGRGVGILDYEDFLQTDAAINPGNSGGALVDTSGRLVGINTAILSQSGGNMGIGFAVPANLARAIMDQMIAKGRVVRGYLGVNIQPVTTELAKGLKLPDRDGALVGDVVPDSPAAKAGVRAGDVIVAVDQDKVRDPRHLRLRVAQLAPGAKAALTLRRDGAEQKVDLVIGDLKDDGDDADPQAVQPERRQSRLGLRLEDLDATVRGRLDIPQRIAGAIIAEVQPDSPAAKAGLRPGDVVHEVNGRPVVTADEVTASVKETVGTVLLRVWRQGASRFVAIEPQQRDDAGKQR
ncbi:MAG: DegQ family serine endoprotease [Planctomycetes bacterium]|nr:DegQ family serine endoprotease [Planctomycetota bacterium]